MEKVKLLMNVIVVKHVMEEKQLMKRRNLMLLYHLVKEKSQFLKIVLTFNLGSKHEQQLRFPGESDQAPNMEPGDVIVVLQQEPHPLFERNGDNLIMKHKIKLVESLCGFQIVVKHLDGRKIVITHPPNDPIAPGIITRK